MDKNNAVISHLEDCVINCIENSYMTFSDFLDANERSEATKRFSGLKNCKMLMYGKKENPDRMIAVFVPDFFEIENIAMLNEYFNADKDSNPISCLFVRKDRFSTLNHRDYLGALMGLGIERKMIGDIDVTSDGAYIYVCRKMAKYICENLTSVGRGSVQVSFADSSNDIPSPTIQHITQTVSSLRLDNIVKAIFNLSRTKASQVIEMGLVYKNDVQCEKIDQKVAQGDKIVLRKRGKAVVTNTAGYSKKGKVIIEVDKYQ